MATRGDAILMPLVLLVVDVVKLGLLWLLAERSILGFERGGHGRTGWGLFLIWGV
jgi:hypothetical protein